MTRGCRRIQPLAACAGHEQRLQAGSFLAAFPSRRGPCRKRCIFSIAPPYRRDLRPVQSANRSTRGWRRPKERECAIRQRLARSERGTVTLLSSVVWIESCVASVTLRIDADFCLPGWSAIVAASSSPEERNGFGKMHDARFAMS